MQLTTDIFIETGKRVIRMEGDAIYQLIDRINADFAMACQIMLRCTHRVVVMGMGKSGHIGHKIAATLASTGTPSFFVHPAEAGHGDFGMITPKDVLIVLSNSGETQEILTLLPMIKRAGIPLITLTGNPHSTLARHAMVNLNTGVQEEACSLDLAPTSSTTTTLAMGDAIAIALLNARGFTQADFALSHPSGSLGRRLLLTVEHLMHKETSVPRVHYTATLQMALLEMTRCRLGATAVIDEEDHIVGLFTDGDLRRAFNQELALSSPIKTIMTLHPKISIGALLASEALRIMEDNKINFLPIKNHEDKLIGALNMHDLLKAGII